MAISVPFAGCSPHQQLLDIPTYSDLLGLSEAVKSAKTMRDKWGGVAKLHKAIGNATKNISKTMPNAEKYLLSAKLLDSQGAWLDNGLDLVQQLQAVSDALKIIPIYCHYVSWHGVLDAMANIIMAPFAKKSHA